MRVENGGVTLTGTVPWHYQKESAEHDVHRLHGVVSVCNQIKITPTVDSKSVGDDITRALHRSWYYDPTIKVSAHGGAITLTDDVTTWNARGLAGATAWSAPGATSVENDIQVVS